MRSVYVWGSIGLSVAAVAVALALGGWATPRRATAAPPAPPTPPPGATTAAEARAAADAFFAAVGWTVKGTPKVEELKMAHPRWRVTYRMDPKDDLLNVIAYVGRDTPGIERAMNYVLERKHGKAPKVEVTPEQAEAKAREYLRLAGFTREGLVVAPEGQHPRIDDGQCQVYFTRRYEGVDFAATDADVQLDPRTGGLLRLFTRPAVPDPPTVEAKITREQADTRAVAALKTVPLIAKTPIVLKDARLLIHTNTDATASRLAWYMHYDWDHGHVATVIIDAVTGEKIDLTHCG